MLRRFCHRTSWLLLAAVLAVPGIAEAGSGPWTLEARENNVYVGADYYRYGRFNGAGSQGTELATGITAAGLTGVWTMGLAYGIEAEGLVSFESVRPNQPADCPALGGPDFCEPTAGLGDIAARLKWRFVDEAYGAPVSMAVSGGVRSGEAYAAKRGRLTTLGDGQSDVGAGLSVGRTDSLGRGWYRANLDLGYWYRFPNATIDGTKAPADEVGGAFDLMLSPHARFALGPSVAGFSRVGGQPFDVRTADFSNPDVWNSLAASQLKVGVKVGVFSVDNGPTVSITVLQTVLAANNPSDTLAVSVGVGQWLQAKERDPNG